MHLVHAGDPFLGPLRRVDDGVAGLQRAAVDPDEGQVAELVVDDLEGEPGEGAGRVGRDDLALGGFVLALLRRDLDAGHLGRARQVVDHRVQQRLHALVLEGGAAEHRAELTGDGALLQALLQQLERQVLGLEVDVHRLVERRRRGLDQLGAVLGGELGHVLGDRLLVVGGAEVVALPDDRLHLDQVDEALHRVLDADRQLQGDPVDAELLGQGRAGLVEIGAGAVELVDEDDARDVVAVRQAPVRLGLRLHAGDALDDEDGAVEHAQRTVHLDVEIDMAGRVDDVDLVVLPPGGHGGGGDGDPPLALLRHVVGGGVAVMDLTDPVGLAGVVQDPLGRGGLPGVDMRRDPDVADLV